MYPERTLTEEEPVAISGAVQILINAVLVLVVAFGVDLSAEQSVAIMGVVNAAMKLYDMVFTRAKVTPWPIRPEDPEVPDVVG